MVPHRLERVRAYVPATWTDLAAVPETGVAAPRVAFIVDDAIRTLDPEGDEESWEFLAFVFAAQTSAVVVAADADLPARRVVISVDVPAGDLQPVTGPGAAPAGEAVPGRVVLAAAVPPTAVAAVHVDDAEGAAVLTRYRHELADRTLSDAAEQALLDTDLAWYLPHELPDLLLGGA